MGNVTEKDMDAGISQFVEGVIATFYKLAITKVSLKAIKCWS